MVIKRSFNFVTSYRMIFLLLLIIAGIILYHLNQKNLFYIEILKGETVIETTPEISPGKTAIKGNEIPKAIKATTTTSKLTTTTSKSPEKTTKPSPKEPTTTTKGSNIPTQTPIKTTQKPRPDIYKCNRNPYKNITTLPDLTKNAPKEPFIFFLETSCRTYDQKKVTLLTRQACAIEAAALTNPNFEVHLIFTNPGIIKDTGDINDRILQSLKKNYKNLKISHIDIDEYFLNTPVEDLHKSNLMLESRSSWHHLSDVLRYLTMWKFGGIYLDMDVISLKSYEDLEPNFTGVEYAGSLGAGVMRFTSDGKGHQWVQEILEHLNKNFKPKEWSTNANGVLVKQVRKICNTTNIGQMTPERCQGFKVYENPVFYHLSPSHWQMFFNTTRLSEGLPLLTNSIAVHMWNSYILQAKPVKGGNTIYELLFMEFCPKVYAEIKQNDVFR